MRVRISITIICLLALVAMKGASLTSQEPGQAPNAGFMRLKMDPAKKILEGIALGDFQMIRTSSEQMRKLALDADWMVMQTEEYHRHSQDYQSSLNLLSRMCDESDLDGVTLAYMQMTMRCVACHKMIRDARVP